VMRLWEVRHARAASRVIVVALLLTGTACNGDPDRKPLFPAEGKVLCDAKPAAGAIIFLHPVDAEKPGAARPHGTVDKDGSFRLMTYLTDDGVPAGSYNVSIYWTKPGKLGGDDGENLLPPKYLSPTTSGIPPIIIQEGENQLPLIALTRQRT
jgi:hypothetical protein